MPSDRPATLARLGRALLDATLMLVALVLLLLVLLAVQVRGIVAEGRALVETRAAVLDRRLEGLRETLEQIEAARPAPAAEIAAELAALRATLQALAGSRTQAAPVDAALLRRLVLAILSAAEAVDGP